MAGSSCHYGKNSSVCRHFLACGPEDTGNPVACVCRMSQKQRDKAGVSFFDQTIKLNKILTENLYSQRKQKSIR